MPALHDLVRVRKATQCATCKSYIYTVPVPVDAALAESMSVFGIPSYDITKYRLFVIDAPAINIRTNIGSTEIMVKYTADYAGMSALFRLRLNGWLSGRHDAATTNPAAVCTNTSTTDEDTEDT